MGLPLPTVPSIFMKPQKTITDPNSTIRIPVCAQNDEMDCEVELAVVLSKFTKNVTEEEAMDHVLGYMVGNDLTARKVQDMTSQWGYSKGKVFILGRIGLTPYHPHHRSQPHSIQFTVLVYRRLNSTVFYARL